MDAPQSLLITLPTVLLGEVVRWLSPFDTARLDCTSRLFHLGAPRSAIEEGLRLRADAAGCAVEAALPPGETSWVQWLLWEERRLLACAPPVVGCGFGNDRSHNAFVDMGGQLLTSGKGALGQGEGVLVSAVPRPVAGLSGVRIRTVAAGTVHTLACSDGAVAFSFGDNDHGQLGHGDYAKQHTPRVIEVLQGVSVSAVAAGHVHSLVVSERGEVYTFGNGAAGQLGHGDYSTHLSPRLVTALQCNTISAVAAGADHSLVLNKAGQVFTFGLGGYGQLGHGDQAHRVNTPRPIPVLQGVRVGAVAAGWDYSLVVSTAGRLYSFGCGRHGQLGHGDTSFQLAPRLVAALQGVRISAVAAGYRHSLALSENTVYSFGDGGQGQLGHGDTASQLTPQVIGRLQGLHVRSVAVGPYTSFAATVDGHTHGWGYGAMPGNRTKMLKYPHKYSGLHLHA
jgi:alpha-tubulin suppressor-like RCC1 family protein